MKKVAVILMSLVFSLHCIGNATAEVLPDKALAIEYLQVSKFEQAVDTAIHTYSLRLSGNMPEEERAQFKKFMQDVMGWNAIKDRLAELVVRLYTREELEAAIAFDKSPLGASITAKNELFSRQFAELLSQNMQHFARHNTPQPDPAADSDLP